MLHYNENHFKAFHYVCSWIELSYCPALSQRLASLGWGHFLYQVVEVLILTAMVVLMHMEMDNGSDGSSNAQIGRFALTDYFFNEQM